MNGSATHPKAKLPPKPVQPVVRQPAVNGKAPAKSNDEAPAGPTPAQAAKLAQNEKVAIRSAPNPNEKSGQRAGVVLPPQPWPAAQRVCEHSQENLLSEEHGAPPKSIATPLGSDERAAHARVLPFLLWRPNDLHPIVPVSISASETDNCPFGGGKIYLATLRPGAPVPAGAQAGATLVAPVAESEVLPLFCNLCEWTGGSNGHSQEAGVAWAPQAHTDVAELLWQLKRTFRNLEWTVASADDVAVGLKGEARVEVAWLQMPRPPLHVAEDIATLPSTRPASTLNAAASEQLKQAWLGRVKDDKWQAPPGKPPCHPLPYSNTPHINKLCSRNALLIATERFGAAAIRFETKHRGATFALVVRLVENKAKADAEAAEAAAASPPTAPAVDDGGNTDDEADAVTQALLSAPTKAAAAKAVKEARQQARAQAKEAEPAEPAPKKKKKKREGEDGWRAHRDATYARLGDAVNDAGDSDDAGDSVGSESEGEGDDDDESDVDSEGDLNDGFIVKSTGSSDSDELSEEDESGEEDNDDDDEGDDVQLGEASEDSDDEKPQPKRGGKRLHNGNGESVAKKKPRRIVDDDDDDKGTTTKISSFFAKQQMRDAPAAGKPTARDGAARAVPMSDDMRSADEADARAGAMPRARPPSKKSPAPASASSSKTPTDESRHHAKNERRRIMDAFGAAVSNKIETVQANLQSVAHPKTELVLGRIEPRIAALKYHTEQLVALPPDTTKVDQYNKTLAEAAALIGALVDGMVTLTAVNGACGAADTASKRLARAGVQMVGGSLADVYGALQMARDLQAKVEGIERKMTRDTLRIRDMVTEAEA